MIHIYPKLLLRLALTAAVLLLSACPSPKPAAALAGPFVRYSVSGQSMSIISAVTPFDGQPGVRDAFLHWFQRNFETVLAGREPVMIEWANTPEAQAGRRGYDLGIAAAQTYLKNRMRSGQSVQITPIPPG
jgi:hypothetical protein